MDPKIWELFTECCLVRLVAFLGGHHLYMSIFLYVCSCPSVCAQKCAFVCPPPLCVSLFLPGDWNTETSWHWETRTMEQPDTRALGHRDNVTIFMGFIHEFFSSPLFVRFVRPSFPLFMRFVCPSPGTLGHHATEMQGQQYIGTLGQWMGLGCPPTADVLCF